jgi:hypothetical protein
MIAAAFSAVKRPISPADAAAAAVAVRRPPIVVVCLLLNYLPFTYLAQRAVACLLLNCLHFYFPAQLSPCHRRINNRQSYSGFRSRV